MAGRVRDVNSGRSCCYCRFCYCRFRVVSCMHVPTTSQAGSDQATAGAPPATAAFAAQSCSNHTLALLCLVWPMMLLVHGGRARVSVQRPLRHGFRVAIVEAGGWEVDNGKRLSFSAGREKSGVHLVTLSNSIALMGPDCCESRESRPSSGAWRPHPDHIRMFL